MSEKFKGQYQVADGYAGGARPQYFNVEAGDLEDDMTDEMLLDFYEKSAEQHFCERICPNTERRDQFVAWAKEQLARRERDA